MRCVGKTGNEHSPLSDAYPVEEAFIVEYLFTLPRVSSPVNQIGGTRPRAVLVSGSHSYGNKLLARHVQWFALYLAPPVLFALCVGLLVAVARSFQGGGTPALGVVVLLLAGPALCYLVDPLVRPLQPWAMRRFLPMIWPLFVVLSLFGWRELGRRLPGPAWAGRVVAGGAALVTAGWLLLPSAGEVFCC